MKAINVKNHQGFTLIELMSVIVILGVLSAVAVPRFLDLGSSAKIAALQGVEGAMNSAITLVRAKAITQGLTAADSNPGNQSDLIIDFDGLSSEIDWRNLCPESVAELGDRMTMIDFINLNTAGGLSAELNNQYTLVGYDIPGFSVPTNQGCYVIYDSFGSPSCTVTVVTADC
ncbi:pilus assembly FimT family protein [Eionea flava]